MCSGWQNDTVYIIRVETTDKHFERSTDRNSYVLPAGIKGLTAVILQAYNSCGEKTELNRTLIDVGISTGQVASHSLYIIIEVQKDSRPVLKYRQVLNNHNLHGEIC